jgi:hypothetical protein
MVKRKRTKPGRQRIIRVDEGRSGAERLIKANREVFRRLAGGPADPADYLKHAARPTIKRTIRDYRKSLRALAAGAGRTKRG